MRRSIEKKDEKRKQAIEHWSPFRSLVQSINYKYITNKTNEGSRWRSMLVIF